MARSYTASNSHPPTGRGVAAASHSRAARAPSCPACGGGMVMRSGASGQFWGCRDFPNCRGTVDPRRAQSAAPAPAASYDPPAANPSRSAILAQVRALLDALEDDDELGPVAAAVHAGLQERWAKPPGSFR